MLPDVALNRCASFDHVLRTEHARYLCLLARGSTPNFEAANLKAFIALFT
jgi:hypothetical protein